MDRKTQLALLDRINVHRAAGRSTDQVDSWFRQPTADYTCPDRLAQERSLLNHTPAVVGLSGLLPEPGTYASCFVGDVPVVVTRTSDGTITAMQNVCRHRGALVVNGCGQAQRLTCPYHNWTYGLDGKLASRRRPENFDGVETEGLIRLPAQEEHGLIWVSGNPDEALPPDPLQGAGDEIGPLDLENHRLFATKTFTWAINWKLVIDTFLEVYHVPVLHKESLGDLLHGDYALFDAFGPNGRIVATRLSIDELDDTPREAWSLLDHATIVWLLQPNTVLIYQQDHAQLYQARPGPTAGESIITASSYVPRTSTRPDDHWQRNFDLVVQVTETEDFVTCSGMQAGFAAGAQSHITFGRNEPLLQHFHRELDAMLSSS